MIDIFTYTDYRKFLRDIYEDQRSSNFRLTYRTLAQTVGFNSAGFFTLIVQGKRNISDEMIPKFADAFGLKIKEKQYFELIVHADQAKNQTQKKFYYDKAIALKRIKFKIKAVEGHKFYDKWYYSTIREVLSFMEYKKETTAMARFLNPPLRPFQVSKAIKLLEELQLIKKNSHGVYEQCEPFLTSGDEVTSATLAKYHMETSELATRAIDKIPPEERNISTLTLALSKEGYEQVVRKTRDFRRELMEISKNDAEKNRVYHLNLQLFPMTKKRKIKLKAGKAVKES